MRERLTAFIFIVFLIGCAHGTVNVAAFSLQRHTDLKNKNQNTTRIMVPGDISHAQAYVRLVASKLQLKEMNVSKREDGFLLFSNTTLRLDLLGKGFKTDAANSMGIFFYYDDVKNKTEIVLTEYVWRSNRPWATSLRKQMAELILKKYEIEM